MLSRLDNYIYGKDLADHELRDMHCYPLLMLAYKLAECSDYERIQGRLAILQRTYYKGAFLKEVSYILNRTSLTKWQKFWLKIQYMFL